MTQIAAEQLLAEHTPALRNFLGARCRDADLTAEMLQEVAARLVTATPRLSLNGNARGYLFRIAANVWRDHLRRELVRGRVALDVALPPRRRSTRMWIALAAAAVLAGLVMARRGPARDPTTRWTPTTTWSATAGYVTDRAMVDIDAQLTRLEQERYYGRPKSRCDWCVRFPGRLSRRGAGHAESPGDPAPGAADHAAAAASSRSRGTRRSHP